MKIFGYNVTIRRDCGGAELNANDARIPACSMPGKRTDESGNFYVHIHLPKTGGSTFNSVLLRNFGEGFESFSGRFIHHYPFITNRQIGAYIAKQTGMKCIASHMFRAVLPYQTAERNIVAITFVRNPVDKFFSYYFHMRHRFGVKCPEKEMMLPEYIEYCLGRGRTERFKGYLDHFLGYENDSAYDYIQGLVDNENLMLFDTYHMKEAFEKLHARFPDDFKDVSFKQENISPKDQDVTDEMKAVVSENVSGYDFKLLELAHNSLHSA